MKCRVRRDIDTHSRKSRLLPRRFFRTLSPRRPTGIMSSVIDTARETRRVYPGFSRARWNFSYANIAIWKFRRLYARISLLRGKSMHKVHEVLISRFLVLLKISNSYSPSLLNKYQITFREWTSQGGRRRLERCNAKLIRLLARP